MLTLLIDGDVLVYKITAANERPIDWGNDLWTLHSDAAECCEALDAEVERYRTELNADDVILAFSPPRNFRYRIFPAYKSNRKGKRKPVAYNPVKEYAKENYNIYQRPDLEGDDILGILATSPVIVKGDKIIVSIDKDLKTIPAKICTTKEEPLEVVETSEADADYWHMMQTLMGDTCDGYGGCPKVGEKTAAKLLDGVEHTYEAMWPVVVKAYEKQGLSEEYALTQARIARICRRDDYDFERREVKLWNPPSK